MHPLHAPTSGAGILWHVGEVRKEAGITSLGPSCTAAGHDRSGDNLAIRFARSAILQVLGGLHQGDDPRGGWLPNPNAAARSSL